MARTSLVFRRMVSGDDSLAVGFPRLAIFLQLVMQRLQAHAQNLRGPRLVLSRCLQCAHNQQPFRFVHRVAHAHRNDAGIVAAL